TVVPYFPRPTESLTSGRRPVTFEVQLAESPGGPMQADTQRFAVNTQLPAGLLPFGFLQINQLKHAAVAARHFRQNSGRALFIARRYKLIFGIARSYQLIFGALSRPFRFDFGRLRVFDVVADFFTHFIAKHADYVRRESFGCFDTP